MISPGIREELNILMSKIDNANGEFIGGYFLYIFLVPL